jgi:hypothetical protein
MHTARSLVSGLHYSGTRDCVNAFSDSDVLREHLDPIVRRRIFVSVQNGFLSCTDAKTTQFSCLSGKNGRRVRAYICVSNHTFVTVCYNYKTNIYKSWKYSLSQMFNEYNIFRKMQWTSYTEQIFTMLWFQLSWWKIYRSFLKRIESCILVTEVIRLESLRASQQSKSLLFPQQLQIQRAVSFI